MRHWQPSSAGKDGIRAVYGDCTHPNTLDEAGVRSAVAFVLISVGMHGSEEAIRLARGINPLVRVLARGRLLNEIPALQRARAVVVFSGEREVALTMTEFRLRGGTQHLVATAEQIDRQRQRIRDELFGTPLTMELLLPFLLGSRLRYMTPIDRTIYCLLRQVRLARRDPEISIAYSQSHETPSKSVSAYSADRQD